MTLGEHLEAEQIGPKEFTERLARLGGVKVSVEAVRLYATGQRIPRPNIMAGIVRASKNAVQPNDFFPQPARAAGRRRKAAA